jgi:FHA domain-containing protein/GAF domain-containing protein
MPAKLTLYPPQRAARFLIIREGESLVVGRDPGCALVIEDSRVSKRHAELLWSGAGWTIGDLGSKNGTAVNGHTAEGAELRDGDAISFGGLAGRFERLSAAEAASLEAERLARIESSARIRRRLQADPEPADLLLRFLEAAMELTRTDRGFVLLLSPTGKLRAEVASGLSAEAVRDERFRGSVGAVRQAVESRGPVVLSDVRADPRLGKRPSVVSLGIAALACVPIRHEGKILGVIYVDSRKLGPALTELELQTLESMADHMGAILAGSPAGNRGHAFAAVPDGLVAQLQERIEELLPVS